MMNIAIDGPAGAGKSTAANKIIAVSLKSFIFLSSLI